jgi:hypothetical protein
MKVLYAGSYGAGNDIHELEVLQKLKIPTPSMMGMSTYLI